MQRACTSETQTLNLQPVFIVIICTNDLLTKFNFCAFFFLSLSLVFLFVSYLFVFCFVSFCSIHLNWIYDCRNGSSDWHFFDQHFTKRKKWVGENLLSTATIYTEGKTSGKVIDFQAKKKNLGGSYASLFSLFTLFDFFFCSLQLISPFILQPPSNPQPER